MAGGGGMHGQGVGGMCGWGGFVAGGMHGQRVCVAGGHVWWGHVWQGAYMVGGHVWPGACMVGGVCGRGACVAGGHAWPGGQGDAWRGVCMTHMPPAPGQTLRLRHTVNERALRIILECILVVKYKLHWLLLVTSNYVYRNPLIVGGIRLINYPNFFSIDINNKEFPH